MLRLTTDQDELMSDRLKLVLDLDAHIACIERRLNADAAGRKRTLAKVLYLNLNGAKAGMVRAD